MEQRNAEMRETADVAGRFLRDLRALRAQAGLDQGELAARAHYPRDVIFAAESGPVLPELPVLAAYVRGCGGTGDEVVAWEDRWRSVTGAATSPLLPARIAGLSSAAPAGARVSAAFPAVPPGPPGSPGAPGSPEAAEEQDPSVIMAALHRFAERMAQPSGSVPGTAAAPAPASSTPSAPDIPGGADTPDAPDGPGGVSGRTLTVGIAAAALLCLLIILLAR